MEHSDIISRFLAHRLARFVRVVEREGNFYMTSPSTKGRAGYLRRDSIRSKLVNRAYRRYAKTLKPVVDAVKTTN